MSEALPPVIVEIIAKYDKLKAGFEGAAAETKAYESKSSAALNKAAGVGKVATGALVVGAIAVGVESTKMAADFQKNTNLLVTAAGESATAVKDSSGKVVGGIDLVRKGILDIGTGTGTSFEQLNEGMYQVEKAGIRGSDGLKVLKAAAQGAAEEGANLSTVTNAMTSVMASYHLPADKAVGVMNALKTAAGGSKATMEEFSGSLSTVLPIASAAGLNFAQVGGAIAALTRHGTSSAEATQELANTIRNLQAPNQVAVKEMNQFGISSVDVSQQLGKKGLGGTLEELVNDIGAHSRGGQIWIDTFKQSKSAAADLNTMLGSMHGPLLQQTQDLVAGKETLADYSKATKAMAPDQTIMASQFAILMNKSQGFSDALRSGSPQATTMANELKKMLGGSTGLNTALMLTGDNTAYLNEMTKKTGDSLNDGATDVEGWKSTSQLLSIQLAKLHQNFDKIMIVVGSKLIPVIEHASEFFLKHKSVALILAGVIGGALVLSVAAYIGKLVWAAGESVVNFAKMIAAGAVWVAQQTWAFIKVAAQAAVSLAGMAVDAAVWAGEMLIAGATALLPFLPLILAVAALGFAAYELYHHWKDIWAGIQEAAKDAWHFIDNYVVHPIVSGFQWVVDMVKQHWGLLLAILTGPVGLAVYFIKDHVDQILGFFERVPKGLERIFKGLSNILLMPFRDVVAMINGIIDIIDAIHFSFKAPGWLGGFGWNFEGFGIPHVPGIPMLAHGGTITKGGSVIVGDNGAEILNLPVGAQVQPLSGRGGGGYGGVQNVTVPVYLDSRMIAKVVAPIVRDMLLQQGRGLPNLGLS